MKNNTKIRLHLSKQLFESLTKQVLAESKQSYGAGMEEVKVPKRKNKDMKAEALNVSKNATPNQVYNIGDLKKKLYDLSRQVTLMKGLDSAEIGLIIKLLDDVMTKVPAKSVAGPLRTATRAFDASTSSIKKEDIEEMETNVAESELDFMTSGDMEFFNIGEWANELFKLGLNPKTDSKELVQLGGKVLTAATVGGMGVATGLVMYSDQIKAAIKKGGEMLKSLAKGKGAMKEGGEEDILSKLSDKTLAALRK